MCGNLNKICFRHGVNSILELELTFNSNFGIGIDFLKLVGNGIYFVGIIDLILRVVERHLRDFVLTPCVVDSR